MAAADEMTTEQRTSLKRDLAVIGTLQALASVRTHDTRFDNETAFVAPTADLDEVNAVVEKYVGEPVKRAGGNLPPELESSTLLDAMGGVQDGQTLYLKSYGGGLSLYVAYWPWGGGSRFTIKVGVHVESA
jgi:hypothetical protein